MYTKRRLATDAASAVWLGNDCLLGDASRAVTSDRTSTERVEVSMRRHGFPIPSCRPAECIRVISLV